MKYTRSILFTILSVFFISTVIFLFNFSKVSADASITCSPSCSIAPGQSVTIISSWNNAVRCLGGPTSPWNPWTWAASGWSDLSGSSNNVYYPSVSTSYSLSCESADSSTQNEIWWNRSVTVTIAAPLPTASVSVSPNPLPYGGNPGITLSSTNAYYCHVYHDWVNVSTGYFTTGTYYPGAQTTPGTHQAEVYCYNSDWVGSGWVTQNYTVNGPQPSVSNATISSSSINPNNSTQYSIVVTGTNPGGGTDITNQYALVNYQGANAGSYRGYPTWYYDAAYTGWNGLKNKMSCTGGGIAAIQSGYGDSYMNMDSCSTSVSGNNRTTTFVVRFDPSFTTPTSNNDISALVQNINGNSTGWVNFDTNFGLTFSAPSVPTISGASSGYVNSPYTYTFSATDSNGYQIRYGIDWSMPADGVADEWLPSGVTYVNSGVSQDASHTWTTSGSKTFKALAQNYQGTNSAWSSSYAVSISEIPVVGFCGTRSQTYPQGSTSYGTDIYCSSGTEDSSPAFPSPGQSVNWTCLGANGGADSSLCTATLVYTTYNVTTQISTLGGSITSTDDVIDCNSNCSYAYNVDSTVTLTAVPASSYWEFTGWGGACAAQGTSPTCTLSITEEKTATASFILRLFRYFEF